MILIFRCVFLALILKDIRSIKQWLDSEFFFKVIGLQYTCLFSSVKSQLGSWSLSIQGRFVHTELHAGIPCGRLPPELSKNVLLCIMIFADSWLARFAHITPQIPPDNTLRHSGWSHSPDLAAPANSGEERKRTFPLICPICWRRRDSPTLTPSVAPIDFEPFVSLGPRIASQERAHALSKYN